MRHLSDTGYPLKTDIAPIVNQTLIERNSDENILVYHHNISPSKKTLSATEDYFDLNDWFSHPTPNGYRAIAQKMRTFINNHGGFSKNN